MKKFFTVAFIFVVMVFGCSVLFACEETPDGGIDYSADNNFEYTKMDGEDYLVYAPKDNMPRYGLLFYIGTGISAEQYDYLSTELAKQGYLVVVSKNLLAHVVYKEEEPTFETYPDVKFFVGGHSQGGGAAVKRAKENLDKVQGAVLLAPLVSQTDSLAETNLPTLLIEAKNDGVLTDRMKAEAKRALPSNRTEYLVDGAHMSFSTTDSDVTLSLFGDGPATETVKAEQKTLTVQYVKEFLSNTINQTAN